MAKKVSTKLSSKAAAKILSIGKPVRVESSNKLIPAPRSIHATMAALAKGVVKKASGISKIRSKSEFEAVANVLTQIKEAQKQVKEGKAKEVDPIKQGLKEVESRWKTWEQELAAVEVEVKGVLSAWTEAQQAKEAKLIGDFESGKITFGKLEKTLAASSTTGSGVSTRKKKVFTIVNESLVPREFLSPDLDKIKEAHGSGRWADQEIPGVKVTYETVVVAR